jgi:hypothetical protein
VGHRHSLLLGKVSDGLGLTALDPAPTAMGADERFDQVSSRSGLRGACDAPWGVMISLRRRRRSRRHSETVFICKRAFVIISPTGPNSFA